MMRLMILTTPIWRRMTRYAAMCFIV